MVQVPVAPSLREYLLGLSHCVGTTVYGFSYIDEDGDKIPARDDGDYAAMIQLYQWMQSDPTTAGPITVELQLEEPKRARNKLGLTVDTGGPAATPSAAAAHAAHAAEFKGGFDKSAVVPHMPEMRQADIELGEVLGHGGGGTVYRSLHTPTQLAMAVKVIPLDATAEVQKQILAELEILHRCDCPHIIRYYGSFFCENRIMLCTEYMDGSSLEQLGCIQEDILGRISAAVLQGLVYLQSMKIMHRDIKPSNILFNTEGQIKLCDFGVSTQLQQSMTNTYVGTNAYMAPERVEGKPYTVRSEVWSLGLTLVELAVGRFPYPADSATSPRALLPIELLQCIVHEPPPRLSTDVFSEPFCDFTARCLQPVAAERPTPQEISGHMWAQHYIALAASEQDVEFMRWASTVLRQRELHKLAAAAAANAASPVPGVLPPTEF